MMEVSRNMTNNHDATTNDIMEFLKEHMVMKEDFRKFEEKFDSRFSELQAEIEDIKLRLDAMEKKLHEDTNALNAVLFTEVGSLKKRVAFLEQKLGMKELDFKGASL